MKKRDVATSALMASTLLTLAVAGASPLRLERAGFRVPATPLVLKEAANPSYFSVTPQNPAPRAGESVFFLFRELIRPTEPDFRLALLVSFDGSPVELNRVGEGQWSYTTPVMNEGGHSLEIQAALENRAAIDELNMALTRVHDTIALLQGLLDLETDPARRAELQRQITRKQAQEQAILARIGSERKVVESRTIAMMIDEEAPVATIEPPSGTTIITESPTFTVNYSDVASGVNLSSLTLTMDGVDVRSHKRP